MTQLQVAWSNRKMSCFSACSRRISTYAFASSTICGTCAIDAFILKAWWKSSLDRFHSIPLLSKKTWPTCHRGDEWSEDIRLVKVMSLARLHSELRRSDGKYRESKWPDIDVEAWFKSGRLGREERKGICLSDILWDSFVQRSQDGDIPKQRTPRRHWLKPLKRICTWQVHEDYEPFLAS